MDSKLVVEQMSARWKVKHPDMQVLARRGRGLVRQLAEVRFTHIRGSSTRTLTGSPTRRWMPRPPAATWHRPTRRRRSPRRAAGDRPADNVAVRLEPRRPRRPTVALLLRHGETPLSVEKRFSGRTTRR